MAFVKDKKEFNNVNPDTLPPQSVEAEEAVLGAILKQGCRNAPSGILLHAGTPTHL